MIYPTIKQLRYFMALVEHNHFGKAAKSCFVSQSAFSVAIKELENVLNGRLVDRTNKSVTVTTIGRELYQQTKVIMKELSQLIEISQGRNIPLSGKLSLGVIPTIAPFLLSKFVMDLQNKYTDLELYLHEGMTLQLYELLMKGELDVILIALPYSLKNVESLTLFKDKFHLANALNSRWTKNKLGEISDDSILLLKDGHCMREHAISACHIKNADKISRYSASSVLTLIEMVKADMGVTYLPEMSLDSAFIHESKLDISKSKEQSYRDIGLVWRKGSSRTNEFKLLGQFITQQHLR